MEQVLLIVLVIVTLALIVMVLLQRSESDGFGLGSGSGANLLSGRGAANLMTRTTAWLAAAFIVLSLVLSVMAAHNKPASIVDAIKAAEESSAPAVPTADAKKDAAPAVKAAKPTVPTAGAQAPATDAPKPAKKISKIVEPKEVPAEE